MRSIFSHENAAQCSVLLFYDGYSRSPYVFGRQALEANPSDQVASSLVAYTHERPRGPEVPKWGDGYEDYPVGGRTPPRQSPPPPVSKWGSIGSGLTQVRKDPSRVSTMYWNFVTREGL